MKNFLDLPDIDQLTLCVVVTVNSATTDCVRVNDVIVQPTADPTKYQFQLPLLEPIKISVIDSSTIVSIKIDNFEMWPQFVWKDHCGYHVSVDQPFYRWLHTITGQGWLLIP